MATRRDLFQSVAKTIPVLAHEGTHATRTPLRYQFEHKRYPYEGCLDENAIRDQAAIWRQHTSAQPLFETLFETTVLLINVLRYHTLQALSFSFEAGGKDIKEKDANIPLMVMLFPLHHIAAG